MNQLELKTPKTEAQIAEQIHRISAKLGDEALALDSKGAIEASNNPFNRMIVSQDGDIANLKTNGENVGSTSIVRSRGDPSIALIQGQFENKAMRISSTIDGKGRGEVKGMLGETDAPQDPEIRKATGILDKQEAASAATKLLEKTRSELSVRRAASKKQRAA
ncbi:MAG TPA: hypothetical protein VLF90_03850 [Patescibacteria group bacterium]|nr:hypothetical protein [Patescibacteria group bacterium]